MGVRWINPNEIAQTDVVGQLSGSKTLHDDISSLQTTKVTTWGSIGPVITASLSSASPATATWIYSSDTSFSVPTANPTLASISITFAADVATSPANLVVGLSFDDSTSPTQFANVQIPVNSVLATQTITMPLGTSLTTGTHTVRVAVYVQSGGTVTNLSARAVMAPF